MALSDTEDPPTRLTSTDRKNSTQSITKASPSNKPRKQRQHVVGQSGLNTHSRNRSYGKLNDLVKPAKATGEEGQAPKGKGRRDRSKSPPTPGHVKRNSSTVSLPRTGSKVSIKRNTSNVSLKRNGSLTNVNKTSRPTTPIRRNKSQDEDLDNTGAKVTFQMDDENNDDEWTEESASQSPSVTRQSSVSRGGRSGKSTPGDRLSQDGGDGHSRSRPDTPGVDEGQARGYKLNESASQGNPQASVSSRFKSKPPDADVITSRLLHRGSSFKSDPKVTSISATGTPGTQTPPGLHSQESTSLTEPSMPETGISRFLHANSSSRDSTWQLSNALNSLHTPPTPGAAQDQSPSPPGDDAIRRAKSAQSLNAAAGHANGPIIREDSNSKGALLFEAPKKRPPGGYTQAKLNLWRTQGNVEPSHNPPAPLMKGPNAHIMMGTEEKRARLYEEAEASLSHLRLFRNPVVEASKRAIKIQKRREMELRDGGQDTSSARTSREHHRGSSLINGAPGMNGEPALAERGRTGESRPVSRAGPRNVRFEVGLDPGDDLAESPEQGDGVEALLRSLWAGGEMENVGA